MSTIIDQIIDTEVLDGHRIVEVQRDTGTNPRFKSLCLYCGTIQVKSHSSWYQYFTSERAHIACSNRACNKYRHSGLIGSVTFEEFERLLKRGCIYCGMPVPKVNQPCKRCKRIMKLVAGDGSIEAYVIRVFDHMKLELTDVHEEE